MGEFRLGPKHKFPSPPVIEFAKAEIPPVVIPKIQVIEKIVHINVPEYIEVSKEVIKYVETQVEVIKEVPVEVFKVIEVTKEVEKIVEVIKEVERIVEVTKEIENRVEIIIKNVPHWVYWIIGIESLVILVLLVK